MKKFFSFTFAIMLLISVVGLVGCNGLWDFEDDDDVTATPISFSIPAAISLDSVDDSLLAAVASGTVVAGTPTGYSNLKAYVYAKSATAATADTLVTTTPLDINADGTFTITFSGFAGNYYVKIVNPNVPNFVMYKYFDSLAANITATQSVNEESTAAGLAVQAAKADGRVVAVADIPPATLNTLTTTVVTYIVDFTKDINSLTSDTTFVDATKVAVTGVTLDKATLSLVAGENSTLVATVVPTDATDKTVAWSSSDTAVATVDATGKVTAVAAGNATITVTTTDGSFTATCAVTVTAAPVAVTGVTLNKATTSLIVGANETLVATVAPTGATTKTVTWSSSNTAVATVDSTGKVTAVAAGQATITVTTTDGSKTATCVVTVTAASSGTTNVTLSANVSGKTLSELIIKIEGVDSTFTTTTTLTGSDSKTWTLAKDDDLTKQYGTLVLIAQNVTFADFLTTYNEFNSMVFTTALPTGSKVTVLSQNTTPATELATSGTL